VDARRLVVLAEPVTTTGPAPGGVPAGVGAIPTVLDRVISSRLDREGGALRWGIGVGCDDESAAARATLAMRTARDRGGWLELATGDPWRDALLADLVPSLAALLDDLTPRQAQIAARVLVDGARQAEVAAALGVSRATVSVAVARGRLPAIAAARRAIASILAGPPAMVPDGADGGDGRDAAAVARPR
jgi:hypothetical protein